VDIVAEAEAIRNIENQWTVALQNKDTDKIMSIYSTEGVVMKPNNSIYAGIQSIRKQVESDFADTTMLWNATSTTIDNIEVSSSGDIAYARGINRGKMKTLTGIVESSEKWIDIYKKIDGQWKCIVGIWNSNDPLEGK
jgi:ketosteroid isomerase-like protein